MIFTDSHCHLAMLDGEKAHEALVRARSAGVRGFLVPGTASADSEAAAVLAESEEGVWAGAGFHPHESKDCDDEALRKIEALAGRKVVVAIGEIGLDYHYMHSPRDVQRDVFVKHVTLARSLDLPILVHNRESSDDLLDLLQSSEARGVRGVLHSFTETYEVAARLLDMGFFISFSGIVTFKNAEMLRSVASRIPTERVLIETDTPFLAPVPHRGKDNEPAFVEHVARQLSEVWRVDLNEVADRTTSNFETLFGVTVPR